VRRVCYPQQLYAGWCALILPRRCARCHGASAPFWVGQYVLPEYQKIGLNLLHFPPGQAGDQEPVSHELIADSAKVMQAVGGDMVVEVRLRGGTPEQAAKSVRYANAEKKFGARFWEVGNEPDLYQRGAGEPDFGPAWYNVLTA
jgi:hypothetical protein